MPSAAAHTRHRRQTAMQACDWKPAAASTAGRRRHLGDSWDGCGESPYCARQLRHTEMVTSVAPHPDHRWRHPEAAIEVESLL